MTKLWRLLAFVLAFVAYSFAAPAHAQEGGTVDEEKGRDLATEAMARYKDGAYEEALEKFDQAREVYPSGQVLRMTGYTMMALGRWLEAADVLEQALDTQLKPLEAGDAEHARAQLKKVLEHVAVVTVTSRVSGARVSIDSGPQREVPTTVRLEPGEHRFTMTARGFNPAHKTEELGAGERSTVTLDPKKHRAVAAPRKSKPAPEPEPDEPSDTFGWFPGQGIVGLVTAGVGVVACGVALGTGIYGLTLRSAVEDNIEAHNLAYDPQCNRYGDLCRYDIELINRDGERAADYQNAAMITGIVGLALVAGGLTLFLLSDDSPLAPKEDELSLACAPWFGGAGCAGTF